MRTVRGWFEETVGGLPKTFWYLWTGTLINRLGSFVLILLAMYLTKERGFSESQAGLALGAWGVGGAAGTMLGGTLADRWGRRPTLLTAHLGAAVFMLALGFARELPLIIATALLLGFFAEGTRPAFGAMMIDVVPEKDRLRAFSLNYWAINLGFACAALLAGLAAKFDYLLVFSVDAASILLTALIIFVKVREPRRAAATTATTRSGTTKKSTGSVLTALKDRAFLSFVLLNFLIAMVFLQHISMLPIAMSDDGLSPSTFGSVIALNGVLIVSGQLFIPRLIKNRRRAHVLAAAAVVTGIGYGSTAFADTAWLYAGTVLIWTLGEMLSSPSNSSLVAELSPADMRGRYQGVFSLSWQGASALAPVLGGLVRQHLGNSALWLGCAGVAGFAALCYLVFGPVWERRATALRPVTAPDPVRSEPDPVRSEPDPVRSEPDPVLSAAAPVLSAADPARPEPATPARPAAENEEQKPPKGLATIQ
ncbi:MFS transporter [Micromonospora sonneratiae]|uniref:MFS transporter n=1 Tax=Micromonospora sonneratiae TaxID=1184706 RepID=A0ABW3YFZ2_9ACTN